MPRVVYIDALFCFNALVDYALLLCSAFIMKQTGKRLRMVLAALFGGLYASVVFFAELYPWESVLGTVACCAVMTLIAFGRGSWRRFIKLMICLFAVTFAFGGGMYAIYFFIYGGDGFIVRNGQPYMDLPAGMFILSFAAVFALVLISYRLFSRGGAQDDEKAEVFIKVNGVTAGVTALLDTGNSLCEPISQNPVMVCEFAGVKKLLPQELWPVFRDGIGARDCTQYEHAFMKRFRLVPYSSVGKEGGMLPAFRPDEAELADKDGRLGLPGLIVAVCPGSLSHDGSYRAVINPKVKAAV